jgi:hypothetical protein
MLEPRYRLAHQAEPGREGHIFQAYDADLQATVAIRALDLDGSDLKYRLEVQRQGNHLASLDHPNICKVYGVVTEGDETYLVQEWLEGTTLTAELQGGGLSLGRIKEIAAQVAGALSYANSRGVVHGNLTPHNIILQGNMAKLINVSQLDTTEQGWSQIERLYASPERLAGDAPDTRADLYSLAVILYQAVTGMALGGETLGDPLAVAFEHFIRQPLPPSHVRAGIPSDWDALVVKALATDPQQRFQSAAELAGAISQLSEDSDTAEGAEPSPEANDPWFEAIQPENWVVPEYEPDEPEPRRFQAGLWLGITAVLLAAAAAVAFFALSRGSSPAPAVQALSLSAAGTQHGGTFASGAAVQLQWAGAPDADAFRLQVATGKPGQDAAAPFDHPLRSIVLQSTSYSLRVAGPQTYYWRVQPSIGGVWNPYTPAHHFVVAAPIIGVPVPLTPHDGSALTPGSTRLCWSGVSGAAGYVVSLSNRRPLTAAGSCTSVALGAGSYQWRVAAQAPGVRTYTGPVSASAHFTVRQHAVARSRKTTRTVSRPAPAQAAPAPVQAPAPASAPAQAAPVPAPVQVAPAPAPVQVAPAPAPAPAQSAAPAPTAAPSKPGGCVPFVNC